MWVFTRHGLEDFAWSQGSSTIALGQGLGNASLGLVKANIAPTVNTVLGDVTESDYTGYARKALTGWIVPPWIDQNAFTIVENPSVQFRPTASNQNQGAYGAILLGTDSVGVYLKAVEMFDQLMSMASAENTITIVPRVGFNPTGNYGQSLVSG